MKTICNKCEYSWSFNGKLIRATCPNCGNKVRIEQESIEMKANDNWKDYLFALYSGRIPDEDIVAYIAELEISEAEWLAERDAENYDEILIIQADADLERQAEYDLENTDYDDVDGVPNLVCVHG